VELAGVRVQGLAQRDQVLALGRIGAARSADGDFNAPKLTALFQEFHLPAPSRIDHVLTSLAKAGMVRRSTQRGHWLVTPIGRADSERKVTGIDLAALAAEAASTGARLGGTPHPVILPEFGAPPELVPVLRDFLAQHDFDRNVFAMTRFPNEGSAEPPDPVRGALDVAVEVCASHGLELHLASDRQLHDDLWTNVAAHMWACRYGIGFFEDLADPPRGLNYNLTTEVGSMLMTGRRCCLLRDPSITSLPTDLVGRIRKDADLRKPRTVARALHLWIRDDLALGRCAACPS
jgi:hypothetical protein